MVVDALDEAASPQQARAIIDRVVLPLAETCSHVGAQVVVGTRRRDDGGDLLGRLGGALEAIDLDDPQYFSEEDLAAYALACLQLVGDERPASPYTHDAAAIRLASRIAAMSGQNFLVAGLVARTHGLYDKEAADPAQLSFPVNVESALAAYLERLSPVAGMSASRIMTALAFAEAPGLPIELWKLAIEAIDRTEVSAEELARFARSSAANFLVEVGDEGAAVGRASKVYRLFHQALNDVLLSARADVILRADDERALTLAFTGHGRLRRWQNVSGYLLRSLPSHAGAAGLIDDLLSDDAYLLHADLRRVIQVADDADSAQGRRRARLLRLTPEAITAEPLDRAAVFSVTEAMDDLGTSYRMGSWDSPYRAQWASVSPRSERAALVGHQSGVHAVCQITVASHQLLASGGDDCTVRLWDPQTGQQRAILKGHEKRVWGICAVSSAGQEFLASGGDDCTVRLWDPQTGQQRAILKGHGRGVRGVCTVTVAGRQLLASASADGTARIWDPETGEQCAILKGHQGRVRAVCPVTVGKQEMLASACSDGTVWIWDPRTGQRYTALIDRYLLSWAVCPVAVAGQELLAVGGSDGEVSIWDPQTGQRRITLRGHRGGVRGLCAITVRGHQLLASAGHDHTIRIWDLRTRQPRAILRGDQDEVHSVCSVTVAGRQLLASGSEDRTIRIWDLQTEEPRSTLEAHKGGVNSVCPVTVASQELLASAGRDGTVLIWEPQTGQQHITWKADQGEVNGLCPVTTAGRQLLASAGSNGTIGIWDPRHNRRRKRRHTTLEGHQGEVNSVCPVTVADRQLLASGSEDRTIRIWDPQTGQQHAVFEGHLLGVRATALKFPELCPISGDSTL